MSVLQNALKENRRIYIIGQGLAGSVLAYLLDDLNFDVCIVDDGYLTSSSKVAAGMWNPIAFKNLHESWRAHELLIAADAVYRHIEKKLNIEIYHPVELVRIFPDNYSANEWDEKSTSINLLDFLTPLQDEIVQECFVQPFGHGVVSGSGWLDVLKMMESISLYFQSKNRTISATINALEIDRLLAEGSIVIQCTGWKKVQDSTFDWLPINPNKGEVLTLKIPQLQLKRMVNFGKFIVPIGNSLYRLGATFELEPKSIEPTQSGYDELVKGFEEVCKKEVEILEHLAGYRPTMPDRNPIIGFDKEIPLSGIFNGFGSKGVMLVPFFAKELINAMRYEKPISREVDFMRYAKRYRQV